MKKPEEADHLYLKEIYEIAVITALLHGLRIPDRNEVRDMYYGSESRLLPVLTNSDSGRLWVDKYYVAYQLGDGNVHYTYLTRRHIAEEVYSYLGASKLRGVEVRLPADIARCFAKARQGMNLKGRKYWILQEIERKINVNSEK